MQKTLRLKDVIAKIHELGHVITVKDERPAFGGPMTLPLPSTNRKGALQHELKHKLFFYKSDSIDDSFKNLNGALEIALQLDVIEREGLYSKDVEEVAKYILEGNPYKGEHES